MSEIKKSNFAVACSLLSQYLKEKRSVGDLATLAMAPKPQELPTGGSYRPPTTLNLLPGIDVSAEDETDTKDAVSVPVTGRNFAMQRQQEHAPLTVFYGGKVMVFHNLSPEKAAEVMDLATQGSSSTVPAADRAKINTSADIPMPIARRASLHRFLEKRKDRITSNAPYQTNAHSNMEPSALKSEGARSWLALGQEIPTTN